MPMLDEQEYAEITSLYQAGVQSVKDYRTQTGAPLSAVPLAERFSAMLTRYKEMTGYTETNPNAVMHHRLSLYGPPCSNCGKPLRTPKAKLCGSCMAPRD
ncbi:MAG TPA: hypothetical protein VGS10_00780 [Terracidiphilus sp.]|nr:hypothetical protein [Terracidiphilus sp.]